MADGELELVFYSSYEKSREMHYVVQVAALPYLNKLLDTSDGSPSPNQVFTLWAWAVSLISIMYCRAGLATVEEVRQFSYDEGNLLILQIMGIGRNDDFSEERKVEVFDEAYSKFAHLLEHIDVYSNRAFDLALEGKPSREALMDFFKTSPAHSVASYGNDAPVSVELFAIILLGVFMDVMTAGLNLVVAKRGEA